LNAEDTKSSLNKEAELAQLRVFFSYLRFFSLKCPDLGFVFVNDICRSGLMRIVRRFELLTETSDNIFLLL